MKPIVVPVNFTANSNNAAQYAADMALAIEADLHLIHAMQVPVSVAEVPLPDYLYEQMETGGLLSLQSLADELIRRTRNQVKISTHFVVGGVEYEIEQFCKRIQPFVVVMGTSGHSLENMFTGSNTLKAVRHMPYPLLVVPANVSFHAIRNIVLACEPDDTGTEMTTPLSFLKELKNLFGVHFEVIHVTTAKEERKGLALSDVNAWSLELQENFPGLSIIRTENIEEGVNGYLNAHDSDWLVLFPKEHGMLEFHSSQSAKLARNCPVPVMCLHVAEPKRNNVWIL